MSATTPPHPSSHGARRVRSFEVKDRTGQTVAIHRRIDRPDGSKSMWWQHPDGVTDGLPDGVRLEDLPLYGSELVKDIPITKYLVVVEGEKDAEALRAGGIPALATATGSSGVPTVKAILHLAHGAKFILWPDHDPAGEKHMKTLGQRLYEAGAREVRIILYQPTLVEADWPKGTGAADLVRPETAIYVMGWLNEHWGRRLARLSKRKAKRKDQDGEYLIKVGGRQRDTGSVSEALKDAFGLSAAPRKSVRCPMHDDTQPSLWILPDDRRAICYGSCSWTSPGVSASEIRAAGQGVPR